MKSRSEFHRSAHFLGTKIRKLRKSNRLTLDDLSLRCVQIDAEHAPSVSYLSMVENGKRVPSKRVLKVIAQVFQQDLDWFLDEAEDVPLTALRETNDAQGGIRGVPLEPEFLFSREQLQTAIPEMLSQTGTSGAQFAQLLIRAHQEFKQNNFPDIEKAAEKIGQRRMPLSVDELMVIAKKIGLKLHWFDRQPEHVTTDIAGTPASHFLLRSFMEPNGHVYINKLLTQFPARLKFDIALHIGRAALYGLQAQSGMPSIAGHGLALGFRDERKAIEESMSFDSSEILQTWRDFECNFFAGALLCPKQPFKQHLDHTAYAINSNLLLQTSTSLHMRRMTSVSSYPHWHYFDAYPPGQLRTVYRGNGIPLPWGNMGSMRDPCQHWAVFRLLHSTNSKPSSQISILYNNGKPHLYSCESILTTDLAGNKHVLCTGVDLNPALQSQNLDPIEITESVKAQCVENGGSAAIQGALKKTLVRISRVLNIGWIETGLEQPARLICSRAGTCPRTPSCVNAAATDGNKHTISSLRSTIVAQTD